MPLSPEDKQRIEKATAAAETNVIPWQVLKQAFDSGNVLTFKRTQDQDKDSRKE